MSVTSQRQMIIWTFVLVVTFGATIAMVMLQAPTPEGQLEKSARYTRIMKIKERSRQRLALAAGVLPPGTKLAKQGSIQLASAEQREPASTLAGELSSDPTTQSSDAISPQVTELKLLCDGEQRVDFAKDIAQVRLLGKACTARREIESSEIRNDSNGSSATVFFPSAATFMTDYLVLSPGENKIRILHIFKRGGKEEREFIIDRASPARR